MQVKLRTVESSKVVEKVMAISELKDYLQQKQPHGVERADSVEMKDPNRYVQLVCIVVVALLWMTVHCRASGFNIAEGQSSALPQVNITVVVNGKLSGHLKRRYHDQVR